MTTGNDPYVQHLRGQLSAVLDDVTPPAAPTAAVKRRGKAIRTRRRVGVVAGLAAVVVAAALVPGLLRQAKPQHPVSHNKNPKVTVRIVGRDAPYGVIAQGAINGKPWRLTLSQQGNQLCVGASGKLPQGGCAYPRDYAATWPATLDGFGGGGPNALYGKVADQVSRVSIELSDGVVLNLRPVRYAGHRWIGLELPAKLAVTKVVAYSRRGELAYAIPFTGSRGGLPSVQEWLRPGEPVPGAFTRVIGSGVSAGKHWSVTIHTGPWGQCAVPDLLGDSGNVACWSPTRQPGSIAGSGGPADLPWWVIGAVRPKVSYLMLSMTDGTTRRVPTVQIGSLRYYAIVIIRGPGIAHWAAYDASGHRLYGGHGAPSV